MAVKSNVGLLQRGIARPYINKLIRKNRNRKTKEPAVCGFLQRCALIAIK